jgi:pimeloyl-ACP methyl ester carboxylesterase
MAAPLPELWQLFDACEGLPIALIRGAASDVLARATAREMRRLRPDMIFAEIPERGHIPFLDEPEAIEAVRTWLNSIGNRHGTDAAPCPDRSLTSSRLDMKPPAS